MYDVIHPFWQNFQKFCFIQSLKLIPTLNSQDLVLAQLDKEREQSDYLWKFDKFLAPEILGC